MLNTLIRSLTVIVLGFGITSNIGCGPYQVEKFEEIAPNETAFVIPLEEGTKDTQDKLNSVDFLKSKKVAAKRIIIPQRRRDTGHFWGDFEWIGTVKVIRVDRAPVTREWTKSTATGTTTKDEAIAVESRDSINFKTGINLTCSIREEDAPAFLYYFAGKTLAEVVDTNVRGFVQTVLAREFGMRQLSDCITAKGDVFKSCFVETKKHFAEKGLTVDSLGNAEGLLFDDEKIQVAINRKFVAENEIAVAEQEKKAQVGKNSIMVDKARAERLMADEMVKSQEAMRLKTELEIKLLHAQAAKIAAERWDGKVPQNIVPEGSPFLFGFSGHQATGDHAEANVK